MCHIKGSPLFVFQQKQDVQGFLRRRAVLQPSVHLQESCFSISNDKHKEERYMYSRKNSMESIPEEITEVWACTKEDCKGWMRDDFAFDTEPVCHLCHSPMVKETRKLPQLINTNKQQKSLSKGIQINGSSS